MKTKKDPRIDDYIDGAPAFAKSLFTQIRKVIHASCPGVEETIKWGKPWFMYHDKVLCGTVAFKAHAALIFNKGSRIVDAKGKPARGTMKQMRHMTSKADLPPTAILKGYLKQAMKLNEPGAPKAKRTVKPPKAAVKAPTDLVLALKANPKAAAAYKVFSESIKRHYVEWILSAKTETTRDKRVERAVDCMAAGKTKHWI